MKSTEWVGAAVMATLFLVVFGPLLFSLATHEVRDAAERQATRAALRGDCAGALKHSLRAGRVPYDAVRLCPMLEGK